MDFALPVPITAEVVSPPFKAFKNNILSAPVLSYMNVLSEYTFSPDEAPYKTYMVYVVLTFLKFTVNELYFYKEKNK